MKVKNCTIDNKLVLFLKLNDAFDAFVNNINESIGCYINNIKSAFVFNQTNEGYDYWFKLNREYKDYLITLLDGSYKVVTFPEIQSYMEYEWFDDECHLINDDTGLEAFGSSAYFVPFNRIIEHEIGC